MKTIVINADEKEKVGLIRAIDEGMDCEKLPVRSAYEILESKLYSSSR